MISFCINFFSKSQKKKYVLNKNMCIKILMVSWFSHINDNPEKHEKEHKRVKDILVLS